MAGSSTKVVLVAFSMNLGIAISKFIGYAFSGSAAMLAEAVHSVADTVNQILLFLGIRRSTRAATSAHPFGYGMEQYIFSFLVAIFIFSLGGIYSIYEGVHKLLHPSDGISHLEINIIILSLGILLEGYSSLVATKEMKKVKGSMSFSSFMRESKDQILVTVLFEDYAALFGLAIAMLGNLMYMFTGMVIYDSIATLLIGLLLLGIAGFLYSEAKSLLLGEAASAEDQEKMRQAFREHPDVVALKELLTMHLSATQILVNAHVKFRDGLTLEEVEDVIDDVEERIVKEVPNVYKIFIETHQRDKVENLQAEHGQKKSSLSKGKSDHG